MLRQTKTKMKKTKIKTANSGFQSLTRIQNLEPWTYSRNGAQTKEKREYGPDIAEFIFLHNLLMNSA